MAVLRYDLGAPGSATPRPASCSLAAFAAVVSLAFAVPAFGARLKDIASIEGVRQNQLSGYGLVAGLNGTGDSQQAIFTVQSVLNMLRRIGVCGQLVKTPEMLAAADRVILPGIGHFRNGMRMLAEMRLVDALREAALALGYPKWRTSIAVVLRTALAGIATGALVAVARIAGETAPLLFTAIGNQFWSTSLRQPIAALPLQIFGYATGPYDEWHRLAWAGALVLITIVLIISIAARFATRSRFGAPVD